MKNKIQTGILWTLALGTISAPMAHAGQERGGGNAVVCYSDASRTRMTSVTLYDYWEQSRDLTSPPKLDLGEGTVEAMIDRVLERLEKFDLSRARKYSQRSREILSQIDSYLESGVTLAPLADDNGRILPKEPCFKQRFAVQTVDPRPMQKKFLIDRELYLSPATSNEARAGIILHEVMYEEALGQGQRTSDNVRYFNFMVSSDALNSASNTDYQELLKQAGFSLRPLKKFIVASGLELIASEWKERSNGSLEWARLDQPSDSISVSVPTQDVPLELKGASISFHSNGSLAFGYLAHATELNIAPGKKALFDGKVTFDSNGNLVSGAFPTDFEKKVGDRTYHVRAQTETRFKDGQVEALYIASGKIRGKYRGAWFEDPRDLCQMHGYSAVFNVQAKKINRPVGIWSVGPEGRHRGGCYGKNVVVEWAICANQAFIDL